MLGTPDYVAPEQIRNAKYADVRADIYSLGCTLYYLLTGGPPFRAESLYDLLQAHHSMYAKPLNLMRTDVPSELAALVAKMMAKEPAQRFQTPSAVADALKPFDKKSSATSRSTRPDPSRNGNPGVDGSETYGFAETPLPPDPNTAETVFAKPSKPRGQNPSDADGPDRARTAHSAPSAGNGGGSLWKTALAVALSLTPILVFLGVIIHIVIDKNKATVTIERTPDTDRARPAANRGARLFNGANLSGWTKIENGSKWSVENGLLTGRGGGPGKPAVLVTDRRDFTNFRLHARLRYPQVGSGWMELRRSGETTKTNCYFAYIGIDSGRPPMGSLGKGREFVYGTPYPVQAAAPVAPRSTDKWYDVDVEVSNNRITCSIDGNRTSEFVDAQGAFPAGAIAVAGSGSSVIEFETLSIEESRPGDPQPISVHTPPVGESPVPKELRQADRARPEPLDCTGPDGVSPENVGRTQAEWAKYLGRNVEQNVAIGDGVTMTFELAPPGKFWMGSPPNEHGKNGRYPNEVLHQVTLTEPFDVGKFEVTQAQYTAITGKQVSFYRGADRPVEQVTWNDADDLGKLLTTKLSDGHLYRLLTEAEWEYSCRAGRSFSLPFGVGNGRVLMPGDANFENRVGQTSNVGSYPPNALGLYDMHGNVWEWCADWNEPYPDGPATNPFRANGGPYRVARGGCHNEPAPECRAALRQGSPEPRRDCWMGFRLARSLPSVR
jgi:formylglycine-generating enzyme required for sulfatase activity